MAWGDFFSDTFSTLGKTVKDTFSDPGRGLAALATGGSSVLSEMGVEAVGKAGSQVSKSITQSVMGDMSAPEQGEVPVTTSIDEAAVREEERQKVRNMARRSPGRRQTVLTSMNSQNSILG